MVFKRLDLILQDVIEAARIDASGGERAQPDAMKRDATEAASSLLSDEGENEPRREVVGTKEPSPAKGRPVLLATEGSKCLITTFKRRPSAVVMRHLRLVAAH